MATLQELVVSVGANITGFTSAMKDVTSTLQSLETTATESLEHFDGLLEGFAEIAAAAGLATGAFDLAKESLQAFSKAQDVQTSFALLTGSTEDATEAFEGLKSTAVELAIPFESLLSVAQKLAPQFGVGTQQLQSALTAAADAAAATGRDFQTVADGLDRIAITGQVGTRQLAQFGVSIQDIATQMGVSVTQAYALLKKGGQDAQADVDAVVSAIEEKFGGAAQAIGENLSGQFTKLKDEIGFVEEDLGQALAPLAGGLISAFDDALPSLHALADAAVLAADGFGLMATALSGLVPDFVKMIFSADSMVGLGTAIGFVGAALGAIVETAHAAVLQLTDLATFNFSQLAKDWADSGTAMQKAWVTNFQEISAKGEDLRIKLLGVGDTIGNLPPLPTNLRNAPPLIDALTKAFQDLGVKVPPTAAEIAKITAAFELIQRQYESGAVGLDVYNRAVAAFSKQMTAAFGKAEWAGPVDALGNALKALGITDSLAQVDKLREGVAAARQAFAEGRISLSDYAAQISKLDAVNAVFSDHLKQLQENFALSGLQFEQGTNSLGNYADGLDRVIKAMPGWTDQIQTQANAIAGLNQNWDLVIRNIPTVEGALANLGLKTVPQLTKAFQDAKTNFEVISKAFKDGKATSDEVTIAWGKMHDAEVKLSQDKLDQRALGIPDLEVLRQRLDDDNSAFDRLTNGGIFNNRQALEAQAVKLRDQIALEDQLGINTENLRVKLDDVTRAMQPQPTLWSTIHDSMRKVSDLVKNDMGNAFGDIIFDIGKVQDDFKKMGEDMVRIIVDQIIKLGITKLLDSLASVNGVLGTIGTAMGGIGKQAASMGASSGGILGTGLGIGSKAADIGAAGTGAIGDTVASGDTLAGIGQASSGAGSAVSSTIGSIASISGIVTGAISAVSGIIGNFQNARQEGTLNAIEQHTKVMSIVMAGISAPWEKAADGQLTLFNIIGDMRNFLTDIRDFNWNVLHPDLVTLQAMANWPAAIVQGVWPRMDAISAKMTAAPASIQQTINLTVQAANDPAATAKAVMDLLKAQSPVFV